MQCFYLCFVFYAKVVPLISERALSTASQSTFEGTASQSIYEGTLYMDEGTRQLLLVW